MMSASDEPEDMKPYGPVRVALYASVGSNQIDANAALQSQLTRLRTSCWKRGWVVVAEYTDIRAPGSARTGLISMTASAGNHPRPFEKVLVEDIAKVSRDAMSASHYTKVLEGFGAPIALMHADQSIDGWLMRTVVAMFSESRSKEHSKRVKLGIAAARARRAAGIVGADAPTKVPCKHCDGHGWRESGPATDLSVPVIE